MNWDVLKGKWDQITGELKSKGASSPTMTGLSSAVRRTPWLANFKRMLRLQEGRSRKARGRLHRQPITQFARDESVWRPAQVATLQTSLLAGDESCRIVRAFECLRAQRLRGQTEYCASFGVLRLRGPPAPLGFRLAE